MTFTEYLRHKNITISVMTEEERTAIQKEYRKWYQQKYHNNYRKKFKRIDVRFTPKEVITLEKVAGLYSVKPTRLVHNMTMAYLESSVYLPPFETVEEIKFLIRKSANNINQMVKATHIQRQMNESRFTNLVNEVQQMEQLMSRIYTNPKINFKPLDLQKC